MNAALGGVLAALAWGSADFIARFTGGAVGHVNALFGMLVTSALVLTGIVLAMGVPLPALQAGWWLLLVMGAGLTTATLLLYLGLVRGPVTVAAPIAGTFPAFNILLALILGMRPAAAEWAAMAAVMAGVFVVARAARHYEARGHYSRAHLRRTVAISLGASFSFAVTVAAGQEAAAIYERVLQVTPNHPLALVRMGEIAAGRAGGSPLAPRVPWTGVRCWRWWPPARARLPR